MGKKNVNQNTKDGRLKFEIIKLVQVWFAAQVKNETLVVLARCINNSSLYYEITFNFSLLSTKKEGEKREREADVERETYLYVRRSKLNKKRREKLKKGQKETRDLKKEKKKD